MTEIMNATEAVAKANGQQFLEQPTLNGQNRKPRSKRRRRSLESDENMRLLNRYRLGQIARFVHIGSAYQSDVVGQQLQGNDVQQGR